MCNPLCRQYQVHFATFCIRAISRHALACLHAEAALCTARTARPAVYLHGTALYYAAYNGMSAALAARRTLLGVVGDLHQYLIPLPPV
jgi:hypothetical protein